VSNQIYSIKYRQGYCNDASVAAAAHAELTAENKLLREQNAKLHKEKRALFLFRPGEFPSGMWASSIPPPCSRTSKC
jgi:hypothetical protein